VTNCVVILQLSKQQDFVKVMQLYMSCKQRKSEMSKDLDRLKQENQRLENRSTTVSIDDRMTSTQIISIFCTLTVVFFSVIILSFGPPPAAISQSCRPAGSFFDFVVDVCFQVPSLAIYVCAAVLFVAWLLQNALSA
jgi:hypothetical protein